MTRSDWLLDGLQRFLARRSVPLALDGPDKAEAREEEIAALARAVLRLSASVTDHEAWWTHVQDHVAEHARGRGWPTLGEIAEAARAWAPHRPPSSPSLRVVEGGQATPHAGPLLAARVNAQRIEAGKLVGDEALWGTGAHDMLRHGLIAESDLDPYREAVWQMEAAIYGEDRADDLRLERIRRHDATRPGADDGRRYGGSFVVRTMPRVPRTPTHHLAVAPAVEDVPPRGQPTAEQVYRARVAAGIMPDLEEACLPDNWREEMEA